MTTARSIRFETAIRAPRRAVWAAITEPEAIGRWHNYERIELDRLAAGGRFRFLAEGEEPDGGEIVEVVPEHRLVYRWSSSEPEPTTVSYTLRDEGPYTILEFENSGFKDGERWDRLYQLDFAGWVEITLKLKTQVESQNVEASQSRNGS